MRPALMVQRSSTGSPGMGSTSPSWWGCWSAPGSGWRWRKNPHGEEVPPGPRKARPDARLRTVLNHDITKSPSFETAALRPPQDEVVRPNWPSDSEAVSQRRKSNAARAGRALARSLENGANQIRPAPAADEARPPLSRGGLSRGFFEDKLVGFPKDQLVGFQ